MLPLASFYLSEGPSLRVLPAAAQELSCFTVVTEAPQSVMSLMQTVCCCLASASPPTCPPSLRQTNQEPPQEILITSGPLVRRPLVFRRHQIARCVVKCSRSNTPPAGDRRHYDDYRRAAGRWFLR